MKMANTSKTTLIHTSLTAGIKINEKTSTSVNIRFKKD